MDITRRSLVGTLAAGAGLGLTAGLTGCRSAGGPNSGGSGRVAEELLPTYQAAQLAPPDRKAQHPGAMDAYYAYPAEPKSAVSQAPLKGSTVKALTYTFDPVAPGLDQNVLWQAVNSRIGGRLEVTYAPSADYPARFATTIAGGDLPDLASIYGPVQQLPAMLRRQFSDLTADLSKDAITAYPNLAAIPTDSWRKCVVDGALWGVPVSRPPIGSITFTRADLIKQRGLVEQPKSFAEYSELLRGLTDERASRWATADLASLPDFIASFHGVGDPWVLVDGQVRSNLQTPEYEAAVADARKLAEAGVLHPDSAGSTNNKRNEWFTNGNIAQVIAGFIGWFKYPAWGAKTPGFSLGAMLPFPYDDSATAVHIRGNITQAMTVIKKAESDRKTELLRLLDWLATPFGSAEYLLRRYGVAGDDYTLQGTDPKLTSRGENERNVPFQYITGPGQVIYVPGQRQVIDAMFDYQQQAMPMIKPDPIAGLYSESNASKASKLNAMVLDSRNEIVLGRRPVSAWKDVAKKWSDEGGAEITAEYQAALG